ncbi:MAG: hypothetical protein RSD49_08085 [Hafnia sp.]
MKINSRQQKCISALIASQGELTQLEADSAAWHVHGAGLKSPIRLSLTGGDVWQLIKFGLITKQETGRRFNLNSFECEKPVNCNIAAIRRMDFQVRAMAA